MSRLTSPFGSLSVMAMLHARCPEAVPKPGNSKWRWSPWRPSEFRTDSISTAADRNCSSNVHCELTLCQFVQAVVMTDQCYKPHRQITCTTTASAKMYFAAQRDYMPFGVALSEERRNTNVSWKRRQTERCR